MKLADGPVGVYIPSLRWDLAHLHTGTPTLFDHLIEPDSLETMASKETTLSSADIVLRLLDISPEEFSPDIPFTMYGLDSLSAARMSFALEPLVPITQLQLLADINFAELEKRIEAHKKKLEQSRVPENKDMKLNGADHSTAKVNGVKHVPNGNIGAANGHAESVPATVTLRAAPTANETLIIGEMHALVEKYTANLHTNTIPVSKPSESIAKSSGNVVLVTGTTGSIGTNILAILLASDAVARIYAMNRKTKGGGETSMERQAKAFSARGLDPAVLDAGKVVLIEADLTEQDLGISNESLQEVCQL